MQKFYWDGENSEFRSIGANKSPKFFTYLSVFPVENSAKLKTSEIWSLGMDHDLLVVIQSYN